ncbi:MAG: AAA family ATPase [Bacteroidota bacterium]
MKTYALYHLKGGVGKTTSAVNLAYLAAKEGHKTLLWDTDPQGSSTYLLEQKAKVKGGLSNAISNGEDWKDVVKKTDYKNLFLLPSDFRNRYLDVSLHEMEASRKSFKKFLAHLKNNFDYIFIDCPPNLGLSAENVFHAANFVLIPTIPSPLSEHSLDQVASFFNEKDYDGRKLVPFFTLVDKRRKTHLETINRFKKKKRKIMRAFIPYSATIEKMSTEKAPVNHFSTRSKAASSYRNLWQELKWFRKLK